ncbi:MAG: hypothetical protein AB1442_03805 [Nitrospirota bacterium]
MDIAKDAEAGDTIITKGEIKVFLEKEADRLLSDATLDYSDIQGFIISGMTQSSCCG